MTHFEEHHHTEPEKSCRLCSSGYSHEKNPSRFGICEKCSYKVLIVLFVVMIMAAYVVWIGIF